MSGQVQVLAVETFGLDGGAGAHHHDGHVCGFGRVHCGVDLGLGVIHHSFLTQEDRGERDDLLCGEVVHGLDPHAFAGGGFHGVHGLGRIEEGRAKHIGIVLDVAVEHLVPVQGQPDPAHGADAQVVHACGGGRPVRLHPDRGGAFGDADAEPDQVRGQPVFAGDFRAVRGEERHPQAGHAGDRVVQRGARERLQALGHLGASGVGEADIFRQSVAQSLQR